MSIQSAWGTFVSHYPKKNIGLGENGLVDLSYLGLIKVKGPDAAKLLQGQLTCDVNDITPTVSRLAAHCNPKGRIISLFQLFLYQQHYYLQMPRFLIPIALEALKKYAVFFKVELSDASDEFITVGYCGNGLQQIIDTLPQEKNSVLPLDDYLILVAENGYQLLGNMDILTSLWKKIAEYTEVTDILHWQQLKIQQGIPTIYPETCEKFLPHELNLPAFNAVSFNKGCYTGQEIIARMHYRGKLKTELSTQIIQSNTVPIRGTDTSWGLIVDYCEIETHQYRILSITTKK